MANKPDPHAKAVARAQRTRADQDALVQRLELYVQANEYENFLDAMAPQTFQTGLWVLVMLVFKALRRSHEQQKRLEEVAAGLHRGRGGIEH